MPPAEEKRVAHRHMPRRGGPDGGTIGYQMDLPTTLPIRIRSYRAGDRETCRRLFVAGLIGGRLAANDTGADLDRVEAHYLSRPGNHFWVAEMDVGNGACEVVGMIGVEQKGDGTAEIRRLRVDDRFRRRGIGSALMEQALRFCQERNYLRVILDTYMERDPAIKLFEKFQFRHGRTRNVGEREMLYFYLDLYGGRPGHGG